MGCGFLLAKEHQNAVTLLGGLLSLSPSMTKCFIAPGVAGWGQPCSAPSSPGEKLLGLCSWGPTRTIIAWPGEGWERSLGSVLENTGLAWPVLRAAHHTELSTRSEDCFYPVWEMLHAAGELGIELEDFGHWD